MFTLSSAFKLVSNKFSFLEFIFTLSNSAETWNIVFIMYHSFHVLCRTSMWWSCFYITSFSHGCLQSLFYHYPFPSLFCPRYIDSLCLQNFSTAFSCPKQNCRFLVIICFICITTSPLLHISFLSVKTFNIYYHRDDLIWHSNTAVFTLFLYIFSLFVLISECIFPYFNLHSCFFVSFSIVRYISQLVVLALFWRFDIVAQIFSGFSWTNQIF